MERSEWDPNRVDREFSTNRFPCDLSCVSTDNRDSKKILRYEKSRVLMAHADIGFSILEKAFWSYVEANCPFPLQSRHRYTWVRQHLKFSHDGSIYERKSMTARNSSGSAMHVITYVAQDGSMIQDQREPRSIAGSA